MSTVPRKTSGFESLNDDVFGHIFGFIGCNDCYKVFPFTKKRKKEYFGFVRRRDKVSVDEQKTINLGIMRYIDFMPSFYNNALSTEEIITIVIKYDALNGFMFFKKKFEISNREMEYLKITAKLSHSFKVLTYLNLQLFLAKLSDDEKRLSISEKSALFGATNLHIDADIADQIKTKMFEEYFLLPEFIEGSVNGGIRSGKVSVPGTNVIESHLETYFSLIDNFEAVADEDYDEESNLPQPENFLESKHGDNDCFHMFRGDPHNKEDLKNHLKMYLCEEAVAWNRLDILNWAKKKNFNLNNERFILRAAHNLNLRMVRWCLDYGCPFNKEECLRVVRRHPNRNDCNVCNDGIRIVLLLNSI
jgi:hypothetical protein